MCSTVIPMALESKCVEARAGFPADVWGCCTGASFRKKCFMLNIERGLWVNGTGSATAWLCLSVSILPFLPHTGRGTVFVGGFSAPK